MANETKYRQMLNKENVEQQDMDDAAEEARMQLDGDIHETKKAINKSKIAVTKAKSANPFNSQNIIDAMTEQKSHEDALTILEALKVELFTVPTDAAPAAQS